MIDTSKIVRQKTLFDDENSDEVYFKQEFKKLRIQEIKEKEKQANEKWLEEYRASRKIPEELDKEIKTMLAQNEERG